MGRRQLKTLNEVEDMRADTGRTRGQCLPCMNRTTSEEPTPNTGKNQGCVEDAAALKEAAARSDRTPRGLMKVAIDAHADSYVFSVMFEGTAPKPPQKLALEGLLKWLKKHQAQGWEVVCCYEAGPMGFTLHRRLVEAGMRNYVIRPRNWDDSQRQVRTDRSDSRSMLVALDRYEAGQREAFTVVRVPSVEEEQRRQPVRLYHGLKRDLLRIAQRGRGYALLQGYRLKGAWYGPRRWTELEKELPGELVKLLHPLQEVLKALMNEVTTLRKCFSRTADPERAVPVGVGAETLNQIRAEVCDWKRFKNRGQVGSYFGMTPREASSGPSRQLGSITKCGNPRVRWLAVQAAWRLLRFQPDYLRVKEYQSQCAAGSGKNGGGRRRKLVVGLGRKFLIDLWRLESGQTTAEKLGLKMS